jgi:putative addiction module component (TIGR02574 family)
MTGKTLDQLRSQIAKLPRSERAKLAYELILSLDGPGDNLLEQASRDEIARRVSSVNSGKAKLLDREELKSRMRARLNTR